ncbi:MAG: sulfurtransferase [Deltaproteobacteria bacterium]|nr:sulfurtransferase [Deltaproteobacteria bacterium]
MSENSFKVIAGYKFFDLKNAAEIRFPLRKFCRDLGMRGTILLSHEGVNSYLSGTHEAISKYLHHIHEELKFPRMDYKESVSHFQPFTRMLVKVKKEIITMGFTDILPHEFTSPRISPETFKNWLDQNKEMTVLDTRNEYEIDFGKFKSAKDLKARSFKDFAKKAAEIPEEMKEKPVVMYCTGGIRCEKASALFLKKYNFKEVYQLDGGILNYFNQIGSDHFEGKCFVFDNRIAVD